LIAQAEEHGIGVIEVHADGLEIVVKAEPGSPDTTARARALERLRNGLTPPGASP
jgi:hypothetical protein